MASRNHAAIELDDSALNIEDLNSRNGVFVNELYALAPKLKGSARAALRDDLKMLEELASTSALGERFVMKRLAGLEQALP